MGLFRTCAFWALMCVVAVYSQDEIVSNNIKVMFTQNVNGVGLKHPGWTTIAPGVYSANYTYGEEREGDEFLAEQNQNHTFTEQRDTTIYVYYPHCGRGLFVDRISIVVNQTTDQGNWHLLAGKEGERYIFVAIEAFGVTSFNFSAKTYGHRK